jgi:hypothetical protein
MTTFYEVAEALRQATDSDEPLTKLEPISARVRLPMEDLFRIGPEGLEEISDATLDLRVGELLKERA